MRSPDTIILFDKAGGYRRGSQQPFQAYADSDTGSGASMVLLIDMLR